MLSAQDYFASRGYDEKGAAAIVGNGCGESGENLDSTFDREHADHGSGGFLEWRDSAGAPRKTRLAGFADARGMGLRNDLFTQCDYTIWELGKYFAVLDQQLRNPGARTIANLTANFCWSFENPAPATAGLDNRIAHAEAVAARAAQAAPPAPVPQAPAPPVPQPAAPPPVVPIGPPSILPSSAGRIAVQIDTLTAMRAQRVAELVANDPEIAAYDAALGVFTKFGGASALPAPPQISAANMAPVIPQRNISMFGTNWVTSVFGSGSIAGVLATLAIDIYNKQVPDAATMTALGSALSAGLGLLQAKDKNVTGGTVPQTLEAAARASSPPLAK